MLITQGGKRWRLLYESPGPGNDGSCDNPSTPKKAIRIRRRLLRHPKRHAEVLIHECLHAQGWHLDEEFVARAASEIKTALERTGLLREDGP